MSPGVLPGPTVRIPGKLYVCGEYAVVEPGRSAVLISVNKYLNASLAAPGTPTQAEVISTATLRHAFATGAHHNQYALVAAILIDRLRAERGIERIECDIHLVNELRDPQGTKYGLGSSGAVTVGVLRVFDELYGLNLTNTELFRLGLLASIVIAPRASGGDLASCITGGWTYYTSPNRAELPRLLAPIEHPGTHPPAHSSVTKALTHPAFNLSQMRRLAVSPDADVLVGWTGAPASTDDLVHTMRQSLRDNDRHNTGEQYNEQYQQYQQLMEEYGQVVQDFVHALEADNLEAASAAIRATRNCLVRLQQLTGILIETPQLTGLVEVAEKLGVAAKSSGAGGGDCGIAFNPAPELARHWQEAGIEPLDLSISTRGLKESAS